MKDNYLKKMTAELSLSLAILLGFGLTAFAQIGVSISGKVTANKQPIANATVQLKKLENANILSRTQTNANGEYLFENVLNGKYKLEILIAGSEINGRTYDLEVAGKSVEFNSEGATETPSIYESVTIAAGTTQNIDVTSKSISLLTEQQIENRNEITITDALRTVPGLRVQQSGGFGRLATIKIRGLRNQDTAVLIDGQRFRDPSAITGDASPFLGDLQVTNVERVEVLRGSGSSLYGTNAIGGVFDIRTDDFRRGFRGNLLSEGGGLGEFRGRANFGGDFGEKAFYNLGLSHANFNKGVDGDDAARNTNGKASASFNFGDYANLTGRFYFSDAFAQLNSNPDTVEILGGNLPATGVIRAVALPRSDLRRHENGETISNIGSATFIPDQNDSDASQAARFYNFNIALDGILSRFVNYKISYQNLTTERKNLNGSAGLGFQPFGANTRSDFDGNIQTLQAKSNVVLRSNLLTFGYEFEREKYGNDNFTFTAEQINSATVPDDATDAAQSSNTLFVQDQVEAFDRRLQLSGGFRAQFFNLNRPLFAPSANPPYRNLTLENPPNAYTADGSLAYFFRSTNTKLRAHVGNGYRVPSLYERFGTFFDDFFAQDFVALGDPNLKPERSIAFDTGVDQSFRSNRVRLSATYFYTRLLDTIGFNNNLINDSVGRFFGYFNTRGGIARGGEFSAEFKPFGSTDVFTSYTFTKSQQREPQVSGSNVLQTLGVPNHQFSVVVTQKLFDRLTLNFDFVATSSYLAPIFSNTSFGTRIYRFEGNRKGDLTAAYEIPTKNDKLRVRLFGTIENIFDQDYYENGFRTPRATGRGGVALSF